MQRKRGEEPRLDAKDLILLSLLQKDAELSLSALGQHLNLTKMAVSNRIKNLKRTGVIEGSYYKVNPAKVNQDYLLVTQVTCNVSGLEQEKVAHLIAKLPGVQTVYLNFGPYDILFIARRSGVKEAKDLLYSVSRIHGISNTLTIVPHTVIKESLEMNMTTSS